MTAMRTILTSKQMPRRGYKMIDGVRMRGHFMDCDRDGCHIEGFWRDNSATWIVPQKVLSHFRRLGWNIGRDRTRDTCPRCVALSKPPPKVERSMITPLMLPPALPAPPEPPEPPELEAAAPGPMAEALAPIAEALAAPPPEPEPATLPGLPVGQEPPPPEPQRKVKAHTPIFAGSKFMTQGFTREENAYSSARNFLRRIGVADPKRDTDFKVFEGDDGWAWERIRPAESPPIEEKEPTMEEPKSNGSHEPPEPVLADAPRPSTLSERKLIRDYLDQHYDEPNGRWYGDLNDKKAAAKLMMPLAWVADLREHTYGPDVNEAEAKAREADVETLGLLSGLETKIADAMGKADDLDRVVKDLTAEVVSLRRRVEGRLHV
jgi:hypothetical protein